MKKCVVFKCSSCQINYIKSQHANSRSPALVSWHIRSPLLGLFGPFMVFYSDRSIKDQEQRPLESSSKRSHIHSTGGLKKFNVRLNSRVTPSNSLVSISFPVLQTRIQKVPTGGRATKIRMGMETVNTRMHPLEEQQAVKSYRASLAVNTGKGKQKNQTRNVDLQTFNLCTGRTSSEAMSVSAFTHALHQSAVWGRQRRREAMVP